MWDPQYLTSHPRHLTGIALLAKYPSPPPKKKVFLSELTFDFVWIFCPLELVNKAYLPLSALSKSQYSDKL
jgi:hypothetical protein